MLLGMRLMDSPRPEQHYHQEHGRYLIEVNLGSIQQLFNSLDPSPFIEKDLDDDAARYIIESAGDFHLKTPLKLVIQVPPHEEDGARATVADAIHHYFGYMAVLASRELRFTLRQGRLALIIGLTFLFACITAHGLVARVPDGAWAPILSEGLIIMGWVAMWRPLQIFLYDWWPIRRRKRVLEKLGRIEVEVRAATTPAASD
jgi:hypothetical protein